MINKINDALTELITSELGYTVDPDTMSFQNLRDDEFPVCLFQYEGENGEEAEQTIGNFTNVLTISFEIIVMSDEENYRRKAFEQLSRFKAFINSARGLIEERYTEACIIDMDYVGMEVLGFDNRRVAGGISVETAITYQQCRTNPESVACGGEC